MSKPPAYDGAKIRQLRRKRDLSADDLAALIKARTGDVVHPQTIRKIERGYPSVSLAMLARVTDGLGVELTEIIRPRTTARGNGGGRAA